MPTKKLSDLGIELLTTMHEVLSDRYPPVPTESAVGQLATDHGRINIAFEAGKREVVNDIRLAIEAKNRR